VSTITSGQGAQDATRVDIAVGSASQQPTIPLSAPPGRATPTASREELEMRLAVAGYRVDGLLATGRHGPIYRAVRQADGLGVTIHVVEVPLSAQQRQRFLSESKALLDLPASPHLVQVLEAAVTEAGQPYLVTPAAERTLADRLDAEGPLPLQEVAAAARAAAGGLTALHRAGLLHANLTPGNLLVLPNGQVAVTGIALPAMLELAAANPCPYHPPEVLGGGAWSVAGDVYALAATLFALLSGRAPHGGGDGAVLRAMAGPPPRPPRDGLPDAVHAALRRGLAPEPAARHPSPATLAEELCAAAPPPAPAGSAVPTLPPAPPGSRAGRPLGSSYLLHEPIGSGASGQVWCASRRHDGSRVAVKLLRREHATNPEMVARFLQERTALLSVGHPHLVRVRDLVAEGEVLALVMDLVDGVDLRRTMATARLGRADACTLLGQVVAALAAVHAAGIVHRDVKPENVLVERAHDRLSARLTDFGIAHVTAASALTRTDQLLGTVDYLAPEVVGGDRATPAADVYAFGVVAYELLAGHRPFTGDHPFAVVHAQLEREPPRPHGMADDVWQVLQSCLAKDPAARPDAAALAATFEALGSAVGDSPLAPVPAPPAGRQGPLEATAEPPAPLPTGASRFPPPPAPPRQPGGRGRHPLLLWAAAAVALAAVAAAAGVLTARQAPPARPAPTTIAEAGRFVAVPVVATSPGPGTVVLRFGGGPELDGFQHYTIFWNLAKVLESGIPGTDTEYVVTDLHPGTRYCFRVAALTVDDGAGQTPARTQRPPEACLTPDGPPD
jgi:serine/threonine protein kinase